MNSEIDLSRYIRVILKHFRVGLLLFVIVAGAVVASQLLKPSRYTATSTLIALSPQFQWRFDVRVLPIVEVNKNWQREFTEVSKDPWLQRHIQKRVLDQSDGHLEGSVSVRAGRQSLIHVDATASSPEIAARLANAWAEEFVGWVDSAYGTGGLIDQFVAETAEIEAVFESADMALRDFKSQTGIGFVPKGQATQTGYEWLGPLGFELEEYSRQLARQNVAITNLQLLEDQLQAVSKGELTYDEVSWQLLDVPAVASRGRLHAELFQAGSSNPDDIQRLLAQELASHKRTAASLETIISANQAHISQLTLEFDRLMDERMLASENYLTFRRKVDEMRLQSEIEGTYLDIVSRAEPPISVDRPSWMMTGLAAAVLGLLVAIAGCYATEYWETRAKRA